MINCGYWIFCRQIILLIEYFARMQLFLHKKRFPFAMKIFLRHLFMFNAFGHIFEWSVDEIYIHLNVVSGIVTPNNFRFICR